MTLKEQRQLVMLYSQYKVDTILRENVTAYIDMVTALLDQMELIGDPGAVMDFIDHMAEKMYWDIIPIREVQAETIEHIDFYR